MKANRSIRTCFSLSFIHFFTFLSVKVQHRLSHLLYFFSQGRWRKDSDLIMETEYRFRRFLFGIKA